MSADKPDEKTELEQSVAKCKEGASKRFLPFEKAALYACSLGLKNTHAWEAWRKTDARPPNVPTNPDTVYKHVGWQGWGHWLGTGNVKKGHNAVFLAFLEAREHARSLELKGRKEWVLWCKTGVRPPNVPAAPDQIYKHTGWQGWGHWLDTGNVKKGRGIDFLPFKKALAYAHSLGKKSQKEWKAWCKNDVRPANVPSNPDQTYKHGGWQGWGHWLDTGKVKRGHSVDFLPFKTALAYARSLNLKGQDDWVVWRKSDARPSGIPPHPDKMYKHDGWLGWVHWLGTGKEAEQIPPPPPLGPTVVSTEGGAQHTGLEQVQDTAGK